jgi:hypothetical protein
MAKFYNLADQKLFEKYQFLPQEQYRLGLNLPTDPVPDPVVDQGIVNTDAFANSGGGGDGFNAAGNMFGEGTAVNPVYGSTPITGGLGEAGTGVNPVTGDIVGGGNIVDEFGTKGEVYSKGAFDSLESEEAKKGFLSRMMNSFRQKTSNLPDWVKTGMTAAQMLNPLTAIPSLLSKFGGGSGPQYGIAGLTDQQKNLYDNLAANNYLYQTDGGMKTYDGKNLSQFDQESIDNYFDSQKSQINPFTGKPFGTISAYKDYLDKGGKKEDKKTVKELLETYKMYDLVKDNFKDEDETTITNPNITTDMINEFADNNNTPIDTPPQDTQTPNQDGVDNRFDGPGAGTGGGYDGSQNDRPDDKQDGDGNGGQGNQNDNSPGSQGPGGSDEMGSFARGGRAGYFFGGRAGYAEGGPIYSRLGTLSSGVQSAEQQLQGINASLQKAESDLGSDSPGGGSSLAGGPSFTSNFEDANNQGPGSNLLFGGSMDQDSPTTPPVYNKGEESFDAIKTRDPITGGGPLQELQAANPISSIGGNSSPPSTGGVQGTLSTQSNEGLTGQELVNQIQMRIQQRDVKTPSFNAYAQDVMKTGGYPTKQFEDYSNLDPVGSGLYQLSSAGGGLGGLLGNNSGGGTITDMRDRSNDNRSYEERVRLAQEANDAPTGLMRSDGTRAKVTYKNFMGLDPQTTNLNALPLSGAQPISEERMNSLNRSAIGNGFYDLNKGLGGLL